MALSAKLELRQGQSLVMTPQLMQAIKLLQLSNLDLEAYVAGEIERNPLLEQGEGEEAPRANGEARGPAEEGTEGQEQTARDTVETAVAAYDADPADVFPDDAPQSGEAPPPSLGSWTSLRGGGNGEDYDLESFIASEETLKDHVERQIVLAFADPKFRFIARALTDMLDEAGYLREPPEGVAARLGASVGEVEAVLSVLRGFEPPGLFARDLAECLALQLRERDRLDPAMQALLDNLEMAARRDFAGLRRVCSVDDEDIADMLAELKRLNPRPAGGWGGGPVQTLVPDVVVRAGPDGAWLVELNSDTLPRVLVNQTYYAEIARSARRSEDKAYLGDCLQTANWLVKSLDQRARTILKVAGEIVRQQDAFLTEGVSHLRPLNLRAIADAIGMHESTVSRVTANKSMSTPRGIFEMKYFFTSAIASAGGGEAHSAEAVRHRIRQLVETETAKTVLSDDEIVRRLNAAGIEIARRTVAKYREAMRIPSSVHRRREKSFMGP